MISGRTRTAEQRAAGAEMREDTGMGTVAAAETEETAGTERRAVVEMEEVAAEETEEAAVAEIAEAAGDMAGDTEPAAAGDRRVREALRDARVLKDREVHRGFRDLTEHRERQARWDRWARWVRQERRERQVRWAR